MAILCRRNISFMSPALKHLLSPTETHPLTRRTFSRASSSSLSRSARRGCGGLAIGTQNAWKKRARQNHLAKNIGCFSLLHCPSSQDFAGCLSGTDRGARGLFAASPCSKSRASAAPWQTHFQSCATPTVTSFKSLAKRYSRCIRNFIGSYIYIYRINTTPARSASSKASRCIWFAE